MRFLRLLPQLPRTSRYQAAVNDDDERADALVASDPDSESQGNQRPPLEVWTHEAELLALIADLLAHHRADYAAVHSKNHQHRDPTPTPRPETALERARRRRQHAQHADVVKAMLPDST